MGISDMCLIRLSLIKVTACYSSKTCKNMIVVRVHLQAKRLNLQQAAGR
jgi:hypothetical protein